MAEALRGFDRELLLFAAFWMIVSALDEIAIDFIYLWVRWRKPWRSRRITEADAVRPLHGATAIFVPAWHEAAVIEPMIAHTLRAWQQRDYVIYVGCYANDPATLAAAMAGSGGDPRVRLVIHDRAGPTTKADCLNRLYRALCADEARTARAFAAVVLHDAEDMVHPAALALIDRTLRHAEFVQLPVRPECQAGGRWIAGHYGDEFAEAHAKAMVVRDALGASLPAAGVGCGFDRKALAALAGRRSADGIVGPFAAECLTEDYELGLLIARTGGRSRFVRLRDERGALIATRSYFPAEFYQAVRQKSRWVHGIALQSWDRLGWHGNAIDMWMTLRDRRGPLSVVVLCAAYAVVFTEMALWVAVRFGPLPPEPVAPTTALLVKLSLGCLVWRMVLRMAFTTREYGVFEGICAAFRMIVGNVIAIFAGHRALSTYLGSLAGAAVVWDKTEHDRHPAPLRAAAFAPVTIP